MQFELIIIGILIILGGLLAGRLIYHLVISRTSLYLKGSDQEALEAFKINTEPMLARLEPPNDCDEAARALRELRSHYVKLLKRLKRVDEDSKSYRLIFTDGLQPVLDKISYTTSSRECFKNIRYKKSFDQFIRTIQQQGSTQSAPPKQ